MKRPYMYRLTWEWTTGEDGMSLDSRGYRTGTNGKRKYFGNNVFDGKDPRPVIEAERAISESMHKLPPRAVGKLVVILRGDQANE